MKNAMKKISAIAMAFTLLGSGTAVIKNVAPKFDNSITVSAASYHYDYDYWNHTKPGANDCFNNGSSGDKVKWIQCAINYGFGCKLDVDGSYGPLTKQAVREFQEYYNRYRGGSLDVDGIFGPQTRKAMCRVLGISA